MMDKHSFVERVTHSIHKRRTIWIDRSQESKLEPFEDMRQVFNSKQSERRIETISYP